MLQEIAFWALIVIYIFSAIGAYSLHGKPKEGTYDGWSLFWGIALIALLWAVATGAGK